MKSNWQNILLGVVILFILIYFIYSISKKQNTIDEKITSLELGNTLSLLGVISIVLLLQSKNISY